MYVYLIKTGLFKTEIKNNIQQFKISGSEFFKSYPPTF